MLLRGKNAAGGTDGKTEKASIGELRRSLIDTLTKERQVAIESAIIKRAGPGARLILHPRLHDIITVCIIELVNTIILFGSGLFCGGGTYELVIF
jgi:hypothetical protein